MAAKVLIYDGECAYCRGFARLVHVLDFGRRFRLLPFESPDAQRLLRAQFGKQFGFAMFLFEDESVSWGQEAARRIVQALSLRGASLAFLLYPKILRMVSWLTRRERPVCGPSCAGGGLSGSVPVNERVKELRELLFSL